MPAGPVSTPRVGATGVLSATGAMLYRDANGDLTDVIPGVDGQILTLVGGVPDWVDPIASIKASFQMDATDPVFEKIDLGAGDINLPTTKVRGSHAVIAYDDTVIEGIPWQRFMPLSYTAGASLALKVYWVADTAIAGDVVWAAAFERDNAGGHDIDVDSFAALQTAPASTAPGTAGVIQVATIAFTAAQIDGVVSGDPLRIFLQRTADAVGDTMVGDAQLLRAILEEV